MNLLTEVSVVKRIMDLQVMFQVGILLQFIYKLFRLKLYSNFCCIFALLVYSE